ncbi:unnamed protein product [Heterobilharzia americana]|nr:unnamed protein product [Heterobilharzia americana]
MKAEGLNFLDIYRNAIVELTGSSWAFIDSIEMGSALKLIDYRNTTSLLTYNTSLDNLKTQKQITQYEESELQRNLMQKEGIFERYLRFVFYAIYS